jgi:hypothetical protein
MAAFVSLCSLLVSVSQLRMAREQQYAAVWPNLLMFWASERNDEQFTHGVKLWNQGIGPAIIRDVKVHFRGKEYPDISDAVHQLFREVGRDSLTRADANRNSLTKGFSFAPNMEWTWFSTSGLAGEVFQEHVQEFRIEIRYESVYGESWTTRLGYPDNLPKKE